MADETERWTSHDPSIAVVAIVPVPDTPIWTVRVQVPHPDAPATGWAPYVFFSAAAAEQWLAGRASGKIMPTLRECDHGGNDLAIACIVNGDGVELLLSEPMPRTQAAGVAAMFAAEFRRRSR